MPQQTQLTNCSKRHGVFVALLYLLATILLIACRISGITEDLHIESPQESSRYHSRQQNIGGQFTAGYGVSASFDFSKSKVDANHQSINADSGERDAANNLAGQTERGKQLQGAIAQSDRQADAGQALLGGQSGLFAGDDGYQITNTGTATLKGGIITSTRAAEEQGNNRFITDRLILQNLDNFSHYKGKSIGIGLSAAISGDSMGQQQNPYLANQGGSGIKAQGIGHGSANGNESGTTHASINTANLVIRDQAGQQALTGQTADALQALVNRHSYLEDAKSQSGGAQSGFDAQDIEKSINLARDVTREFGRTAPQMVALATDTLGDTQAHEIRQTAQQLDRQALAQTSDPEQRAILQQRIDKRQQELDANQANYEQWKEGGTARNLLHAAAGGLLAGNWQGAASSYAASASAPALNRLDNPLFNRIAAPAMGALIGAGEMGAIMAAGGTDWNNRRLHPSERKIIGDLAKELAQKNPEDIYLNEDEWRTRLTLVANALVDENYNDILLQEISRSGWQSGDGKTLGGKYLRSLEVAIDVLQEERNRPNFLTWTDGSPIKAHGKPVQIFGATPEQYRDHKLFGATQPDNPYNYAAGKEAVENYLKHRFDNTYGAGSHKHTDEILNFEFESRKGLPQRQQLEKDYYSYSGTGEVYPSYPEDWVMLGHGLLRNLPKNLGKQAGRGVDDFADDALKGGDNLKHRHCTKLMKT